MPIGGQYFVLIVEVNAYWQSVFCIWYLYFLAIVRTGFGLYCIDLSCNNLHWSILCCIVCRKVCKGLVASDAGERRTTVFNLQIKGGQ